MPSPKKMMMAAAGAGGGGRPDDDGTRELWAWGRGTFGGNGQGNTTSYSSPVQVGSLTTWNNDLGAVPPFSLQNGKLYTWGTNPFGQFGLGNTTDYSVPVQVGSLTDWYAVHSRYVTQAVKSNNTLWAFGKNNRGQSGFGDTIYRSSPVQVGSLTDWEWVESSSETTLAVKTDGTLWSWGRNNYGVLGLGLSPAYLAARQSSPVQIGALTSWSLGPDKISVGPSAAAAVRSDGTLWVWGNGRNGRLGTGNTASASSPVQVGALTNWSSVSVGKQIQNTWAIKTDGTLWAWGYNSVGQLGLGNTISYSSPVQVGTDEDWEKIQGGGSSSSPCMAIKTDGTLWTWGGNSFGMNGLGGGGSLSVPTQVGELNTWRNVSHGGSSTNTFAVKQVG